MLGLARLPLPELADKLHDRASRSLAAVKALVARLIPPQLGAASAPESASDATGDPLQQWRQIARRNIVGVGRVLGLRQSADADDADLPVPDFRSRADQPQPRYARHAVAGGARFHRRAVAARHRAPPGARPAFNAHGNDARRPGSGLRRARSRRLPTAEHSRRCASSTRYAVSLPARPCWCCSMRPWRRSISLQCS